jgi:hypothetical protein
MMEYITNIIFIIPSMQTTNKYGVFLVESSFIAFTFSFVVVVVVVGKAFNYNTLPLLFLLLFLTLSQTPLASPSVPTHHTNPSQH